MKKLFLYFFMSLFLMSFVFAASIILPITSIPDNVYGNNDKNINLNVVATGATEVVADFSNVELGMSEKRQDLVEGADRLVATQNNDGTWEWDNPNLVKSDGTGACPSNIVGVTALGLLNAYQLTGNSIYLDTAKVSGDAKVACDFDKINDKYYSQDIEFLMKLGQLTGNSIYTTKATSIMDYFITQDNRYCPTDGCTATELAAFYQGIYPTNGGATEWQLASWVRSAQLTGKTTWANDMINEINIDISGTPYFDITISGQDNYIIGLAGVVSATGNINAKQKLIDLQNSDGHWSEMEDGSPNDVQATAYATLEMALLNEINSASKGVSWLHGIQLTEGGWNSPENTEVTSEAMQAIYSYLNKKVLIEGNLVSPNNYTIMYNVNTFTGEGIKQIPIIAFGSADVKTFDIIVDYTLPIISGEQKKPNIAFNITPIELSAIITDNDGSDGNLNVIMVEYKENNYTVTLHDHALNKYLYNISANTFANGETVDYRFYAKDKANNLKVGGLKSFTLNSRTLLSVNPPSPDGDNGYYKTLPTFTLTKDSAANETIYRWNALGKQSYTVPFVFDWDSTFGGIEVLHYWSTFVGSTIIEQEKVYTVKVDITSPQIENVNPVEDSTITNPKPLISADLDDIYESNSGIDLNSIVLKLDGVVKTHAIINLAPPLKYRVTYQVPSDLSVGEHTVEVSVQDKAGNPVSTKTWKFTYFPISVDVNIISPVEGNYFNNKKVMLNINTDEVLKDITLEYNENNKGWRRLCTKCNEYNKEKSFKDGETNLKIRAIKNFAVAGEDEVTFSIDSKKPKINSIEPKDNSYSNGDNFNVKYNEENVKEITLHLVKDETDVPVTLAGCESGMNKECSIDHSLNAYDGETIQYYFVVQDQVNEVSSKIYDIKADTSVPVLTINSPLTGILYNRKIQFDIGINEKVKMLEYNDNDAGYRRLCSNCNQYKRSKTLSEGAHILKIRATDYAGNVDIEERNFIVS